MFCNQCGMEVTDEGTRFCPNCGNRLNRPVDFENIKNTASEKIAEAGDVFIDSGR